MTKKVKEYAEACEKEDSKDKMRHVKMLGEKVKKLERINSFINPKNQEPIVHFASSDLM